MGIKEDVIQYLDRKKWEYRNESDQFCVKTCPFCRDSKWHFYINRDTGQYQCWKCSEKPGNLYSLKKKLKDIHSISTVSEDEEMKIPPSRYKKWRMKIGRFHQNLLNNPEILLYLEEKYGFDIPTIKMFKLGFRYNKKNDTSYFVIPAYENGKLANAKFRTLPPAKKSFTRIKGMKSVLFNIDKLDSDLNYIIICEGETDSMTLSRLGFKNVVGTTVGAKGFKVEWYDIFTLFSKIYVIYDPDPPGQIGALNFAKRVGIDRCWNVEVPYDGDITDYVVGEGKDFDDVDLLIKSAKQFDIEGVVSIKSALKRLEDTIKNTGSVEELGLCTQWKNVNTLMGTMVSGDLIIISGKPKIGKSTWALNVLLYLSKYKKTSSLYYCLEMRPERIVPKVISHERLVDSKLITLDDVIVVETMLKRIPLYLAHSYDFDNDTVFDTIKESVQRYGIEIVLFDNLHFLVRSPDVTKEVSSTVRRFKLLAEELGIPIILIAQGRRTSGKSSRMTMDDLRDSSSIGTDSDTIIIVHRELRKIQPGLRKHHEGDKYETQAEIIVEGSRYNSGGHTTLEFAGEWSRYFQDKTEKMAYFSRRKRIKNG